MKNDNDSSEFINRMENGNLYSLLCRFCIPSLASSLVTSVYNIVDQLFIGNKLGIDGNAAANVVFPIITLITALSLMCGVGSSAVMNLRAGSGDKDGARCSVGCGFGLMVLCGIIVSAVVLIWTEPVLAVSGCTESVMPYASAYAKIVSGAFVFALIGAAGPFLIRADGSPGYALLCIAAGSILNIVLDALLIVVFDYGIKGAAWATFISQTVSAAMVIMYLPKFKTLKLKLTDFVPDLSTYMYIAKLGAGPAFNFLTQVIVQLFLNNALRKYGAASVYGSEVTLAAAGVANKVNTVAVAIVTGLTNGMQPIISYNYGKKNYERVSETSKIVLKTVLCAGFVIFLCYQLLPVQIAALFGKGNELYFEFTAKLFRVFFMLICLNGLQSSVGGFFSAQGQPGKSILISMTRQIIFLPPLLMLLPAIFGINGVLWAGPIADLGMALIASYLYFKQLHTLKNMH